MTQLLIDIGNTRLKWALAASGARDFVQQGVVPVSALLSHDAAWGKIMADKLPAAVWAVSVNEPAINQQLTTWVEAKWHCPLHWVYSQTQWNELINRYAVDQLGADRWVAAMAAWARWGAQEQAIGIIDAGSAVTVDVISADGVFLGGSILPGRRLMARTLNVDTAQIGHHQANKKLSVSNATGFPQNTASAVKMGVEQACLGGVLRAISDAEQRLEAKLQWVFTGGDGEFFCKAVKLDLKLNAVYQADLVLRGLLAASIA